MRCAACDKVLTDKETLFRTPLTNNFADLCATCYDVAFSDRYKGDDDEQDWRDDNSIGG